MSDEKKLEDDVREFLNTKKDFGLEPSDTVLTDEQKKLSILSMALNATLVQFVLEGLFLPEQQLHFMGHLQDFANRLYNGESIKLPQTSQTLQINSKAGTLFYNATNIAFTSGSENFAAIKRAMQEVQQQQQDNNPLGQTEQINNDTAKPTLH